MDCPTGSSPVSDGGRGLKQRDGVIVTAIVARSPVSDGGRGLKLFEFDGVRRDTAVRPSAMAGVD